MVPLPPHASEMGEVHQIILQHGVAEARKVASNNKSERLCVDAAYEVLSDEAGRIGIVHAGFAMTALPHKRISEAVWERDSDRVKFTRRKRTRRKEAAYWRAVWLDRSYDPALPPNPGRSDA
jgi:hypothetical protein